MAVCSLSSTLRQHVQLIIEKLTKTKFIDYFGSPCKGLASFEEAAYNFIDGLRVRDRAHMTEALEFDDLHPWQDLR